MANNNEKKVIKTDEDLIELNKQILQHKEDINELVEITKIRNQAFNYIGLNKYIKKMREIINNSKSFYFTTKMDEEYIDHNHPVFNISLIDEKINEFKNSNDYKLYLNRPIDIQNNFAKYVTNIVSNEILFEWSNNMREYIEQDKDLNERFNKLGENIKNIIFSSIHTVGVSKSPDQNRIYISLVL